MFLIESPSAEGEIQPMRFILNKRTYDTAASVAAAISRGILDPPNGYDANPDFTPGAESIRYETVLYRTPKGAFFIHNHRTVKFPRGKPVVEDYAWPVTPEEAVAWIEREAAMVLDPTGLALPEEA